MNIEIHITEAPISAPKLTGEFSGSAGAIAEFSGVVRDLENGEEICALEYEAYSPMAENQIRRILESLAEKHPCQTTTVIHRLGVIPVGETAIYIRVTAKHRGEAFALLTEFMDRLKQDVPIWKVRVRNADAQLGAITKKTTSLWKQNLALVSLDDARQKINSRCPPLPAEQVNFSQAAGRVLREAVGAAEDFPPCAKSTRDGYAILRDDISETFSVVDTLHAADWKPRQLKSGEAVRVATGASLPCDNLRVVMQEDAERTGDTISILKRDAALNLRQRGEELRVGQLVLPAGSKLNPGALALLATLGHTQPLVSPRLQILHFMTGDEIISPEQKPKAGQIRDSNSILIRSLLEELGYEVMQKHLPEDFAEAKRAIEAFNPQPSTFNLTLVSGGASVGDKDFTRPLLEWLGFEIVFSRVNIRPGAPLIFGMNGARAAFGLPGNPLSHFVCFHLFVVAAVNQMMGMAPKVFSTGLLAAKLDDAANPRETLWPARLELRNGKVELHPLNWSSSGDVTALAKTNALIRIPPNAGPLAAGTAVEFLPTDV